MRLIDADPLESWLLLHADKSLGKNPYERARICAYRRAFEAVQCAPTIAAPSNNSLALVDLYEMDGCPVWVCGLDDTFFGLWALVRIDKSVDLKFNYVIDAKGTKLSLLNYGVEWAAYRKKLEDALC